MVTGWDLADRRWDSGDLIAPSDPRYRARIEASYAGLVDDLLASGAVHVAFVREPIPDTLWRPIEDEQDEPWRHEVIYEVYRQLAVAHAGTVRVIPLDQWFVGQAPKV